MHPIGSERKACLLCTVAPYKNAGLERQVRIGLAAWEIADFRMQNADLRLEIGTYSDELSLKSRIMWLTFRGGHQRHVPTLILQSRILHMRLNGHFPMIEVKSEWRFPDK